MPLLKIHVEDGLWQQKREALLGALKPVRAMLCETFRVDQGLCQLAIIPVWGVDDQAPVAAEMKILPKPDRTNEVILAAAGRLRDRLAEASSARVVVRVTQLDPDGYLALK